MYNQVSVKLLHNFLNKLHDSHIFGFVIAGISN